MTAPWYVIFFAVLIWSGLYPKDYFTWGLEVAPAMIAFVLLYATRDRFRFTPLSYWLILVHSIILMTGGHYTYAEVPLFDWLKEVLELDRNNFDKLGHLAQGFIPAIVAREILIRNKVVRGAGWVNFIVISVCLAISALYEILEWWVAVLTGDSAEAFLALQGYSWDTQSDMVYALIGAISALFLLSRMHDGQMDNINSHANAAVS